jgi:hypothetical protein
VFGVTPETTRGMSTGVREASKGIIPFASTTTGSQLFPATAWIVQVIVVRSAEIYILVHETWERVTVLMLSYKPVPTRVI